MIMQLTGSVSIRAVTANHGSFRNAYVASCGGKSGVVLFVCSFDEHEERVYTTPNIADEVRELLNGRSPLNYGQFVLPFGRLTPESDVNPSAVMDAENEATVLVWRQSYAYQQG